MVYVKMVNKNKIGTDLYLNCSLSFKLANNDNTPKPPAGTFRCNCRQWLSHLTPTLTMGKHHTLSPTEEKQDKLNITLYDNILVTIYR